MRPTLSTILMSVCAMTALASCHSSPKDRQLYAGEEYLFGRWAIHKFNNHDPYPAAESAKIDAFVDFGRGDRLLRFSMGCGVFSTLYDVSADSRIVLPPGTRVVAPDQEVLNCEPDSERLSAELVEFMQSSPSVGLEPVYMPTLRSGNDVLRLNSVVFVLSN